MSFLTICLTRFPLYPGLMMPVIGSF